MNDDRLDREFRKPGTLFDPDQGGAQPGTPAGDRGAETSPPPRPESSRTAPEQDDHGSSRRRGSVTRVAILLLLGALGLAVVAALAVSMPLSGGQDPRPVRAAAPPPGPAPASLPGLPPMADTETVQPGVPGEVQVPDGPAQDVGPFGIDGEALLAEVASHQVPLQQADQQKLVDIGNGAVARDVPDLTATDPWIRSSLQAAFPGWSEQNYVDATRCAAEYAERVIARNDGTVPPDSDDHHGGP